jgi:hypothetical protein
MLGSLSYGVFRAWKLLAAFMAPSAQGSVISQPSAPRVPTKARPSGPTAELGLALGAHLDADFETFQTCATAGVSCLGESELEGKTVPTPVLSPGRARLAVLVTIQGGSDYQHQIVTSPHVLIATLLPGVGISYAEQEQTPPRESVEFTEIELFPASMEHEPKAYTVDLTFAPNTHMIPLAIRIWGNNLATHQVTTRLRILNRQSGAKATGTTP